MGTRVIDTTTGTVVATAHGTAFTDELERAYVQIDMAVSADRKRDQAQKLIYRLRQSADSIAKLQARLDGMRKAHGEDAGKLAAHGFLPDGWTIEWEDTYDDTPVTPKRLVAPEDAASVPEHPDLDEEHPDVDEDWDEENMPGSGDDGYDEARQQEKERPNKFDAIALEAANA